MANDRRAQTVKVWAAIGLALGLLPMAHAANDSETLALALPTENDALYHGGGAAFYQYIEREFQGEKSTPWEGGRYGFVRNPVPSSEGLVYSRFHEGIDIKPRQRDARGEPLDKVHAIADGKVVYTNLVPGYSNYGNYIVVEHRWGGCSYFSLYGHLHSMAVQRGEEVRRGQAIAVMGYTGEGLNQKRAHLHLELNLMFSHQFEPWHEATFPADPNHHGIYNGINLAGLDIARLYLALKKRPSLTIPEFLAEETVFYRVILPNAQHFELRKLYPWMVSGGTSADSWEVSFNRAGVPLKIEPAQHAVTLPELSYVKRGPVEYSYLTRGVVGGKGEKAALTESGMRLMRLLVYPD